MNNKIERIKAVKAMEFLARQINDEMVLEQWFMDGVADGDIPYGSLSVEKEDFDEWGIGYYFDDNRFAELMNTFLSCMKGAYKSGGLYCDNVVSKARG